MITVILTFFIANFLDLESISTSGSSGFLLIFSVVNYVAFRKAKKVNASKIITMAGTLLCAAAFLVLIVQQLRDNTKGIVISLGPIVVCFVIEYIYKTIRKPDQHKKS